MCNASKEKCCVNKTKKCGEGKKQQKPATGPRRNCWAPQVEVEPKKAVASDCKCGTECGCKAGFTNCGCK